MTSEHPEYWMARAIRLAERGLYTTDPNPRVGCVVVAEGRCVGEGWHERAGEPHAEVHALRQAGERARGSDVYVTLEPCAHFGRTPPCANALIEAGVRRVFIACGDPNPQVSGQGVARLRAAGIEVSEGVLAASAEPLNPGFLRRMRGGRPWVRLKTAASLDGRVALRNGVSQWITGPEAREDVQRLRARSSAIVTGIGTVMADDPLLNVRSPEILAASGGRVRHPLRVVLDRGLKIASQARLLTDPLGQKVIVTTATALRQQSEQAVILRQFADLWAAGEDLDLEWLLAGLANLGCNEILVEAGGTLAGAFLAAGLVDEYWVYLAGLLLGPSAQPMALLTDSDRIEQAPRFHLQECRRVGSDLRLVYTPA